MAGKSATITVRILGDGKGAKDAANDVEGAYGGLSKKMAGFAAGIGAAVGTFALDMGKQLVSAAGEWVNLAKEAEIFDKKADVVFGDSAASIKAWADDVNESFGLSDEKVVGLAASMGDLLVPLGFTREAAADMSKQALELSGALSAWSGGTVDAAQVSEILTKAMLGETDGLKALGISISADEVARKQAQLAAEGQTYATDAQAKAAATQALILEKSTDAQKAWADGTMDSVKAQNTATAGWEDAKVMLGEQLLPIVQAVTAWVGQNMPTAINFLKGVVDGVRVGIGFLSDNIEYVIPVLGAAAVAIIASLVPAFIAWAASAGAAAAASIAAAAPFIAVGVAIAAVAAGLVYAYEHWEGFREVVDAVVAWFSDVAWPALQAVWDAILTGVSAAITAVKEIIETTVDVIKGIWSMFGDDILAVITTAWDYIKTSVENAINFVRGIIQTVTSLIKGDWSGVWDGIKATFSAVWDEIKNIVSTALELVKSGISGAWTTVKEGVTGAWEEIKAGVSGGIDAVVGFVSELPGRLLNFVLNMASAGAKLGSSIINGITDGIKNAAGAIGDVASSILSAFKKGWNSVAQTINDFIPNDVGFDTPFGRVGVDIPDNPIPKFHTGGIVPGRIGQEVPAILQSGEGVFTREQMASMGGLLGDGPITLIIEGTPFRAMLAQHDSETSGRTLAGSRF